MSIFGRKKNSIPLPTIEAVFAFKGIGKVYYEDGRWVGLIKYHVLTRPAAPNPIGITQPWNDVSNEFRSPFQRVTFDGVRYSLPHNLRMAVNAVVHPFHPTKFVIEGAETVEEAVEIFKGKVEQHSVDIQTTYGGGLSVSNIQFEPFLVNTITLTKDPDS